MIPWLYQWLPIIFGCHGLDSRSFHYKGRRFPLCARCTGELVGMVLCLVSFPFVRADVVWSLVLLLPLVADGGLQALTSYESGNGRRFLTGLLFGYALVNLFFQSTAAAFQYGLSLGEHWQSTALS